MGLIVFLEDADTIDPAKGYEEASRRACNGKPCFGATVWKRFGIHPGIWRWLHGLFCILGFSVRKFLGPLISVLFQGLSRHFRIMVSVGRLRIGFGHYYCKDKAAVGGR